MIFYCILIIIFAPFFLFLKVVKRLHDIGWSGWWTFLFFIPIVNIPFILLLIFKAGYKEANHYGLVSKPTRWGNIISFIILMLCLIPMLNFINPFHLPAGLYILYPGIIIPKTITGIWRPVYVRDNQESNIHHIHFPHAASTKPCAKTTGMQTNVEQKDHVLNVVLLGSKQYENSSDDFFCKF
ncbi:MAG: DUF805 domain-containing protein [Nitrosopumilaceae archaeon]|nr:DUF805 domain-containing protein [Nitrosopumilaceae archaeon]